MQSIRNWWERYSLQLVLVTLGIGVAWTLKQTQAEIVIEIYRAIAQPFQGGPSRSEIAENARILEFQMRLKELEQQNQQLRKLLKLNPASGQENYLWSSVIGRSASAWWQQLVIDRGSNQGVKNGSVVLAEGGLVGRITNLHSNSSRVLLISDPNAQVGVMISRTRNMGMLRGAEQSLGSLSFFERDVNIRAGDLVVTSPYSSFYPPGIPVGRVRSINLNRQPAPEAVVEFSVPLSQLEYVKIMSGPSNASR
ncbi:MAG: rod shape-determining protein MreC [Pseudanabaenaceae cyanobacterium bins.68]|nr:rod shape-determining protein MreC [Pseudanabaenaceae cyanobacterium bins.68]